MGYTNQQVANAFVDGRYGDRATTGNGNMSIRSFVVKGTPPGEAGVRFLPALFSYNTPIAVRLSDDVIAVNPNRYSNTTNRHQSCLRSALRLEGYEGNPEARTWRPDGRYGMYRNLRDPRHEYTWEWAFELYEIVITPLTDERRAQLEAWDRQLDDAIEELGSGHTRFLRAIRDDVDRALSGKPDRVSTADDYVDSLIEDTRRSIEDTRRRLEEECTPPHENLLRKVTNCWGMAAHGGRFNYSLPVPLPDGTWEPGEWTPRVESPLICIRGWHVTTMPNRWTKGVEEPIVWHVEAEGFAGKKYQEWWHREPPTSGHATKAVYERIRLMAPDKEYHTAGTIAALVEDWREKVPGYEDRYQTVRRAWMGREEQES